METDFKAKVHIIVEIDFKHDVEPLVLEHEEGDNGKPVLLNKDTYEDRAAKNLEGRIEAAHKANELADKLRSSFDGENIKVLESYIEEVAEANVR